MIIAISGKFDEEAVLKKVNGRNLKMQNRGEKTKHPDIENK